MLQRRQRMDSEILALDYGGGQQRGYAAAARVPLSYPRCQSGGCKSQPSPIPDGVSWGMMIDTKFLGMAGTGCSSRGPQLAMSGNVRGDVHRRDPIVFGPPAVAARRGAPRQLRLGAELCRTRWPRLLLTFIKPIRFSVPSGRSCGSPMRCPASFGRLSAAVLGRPECGNKSGQEHAARWHLPVG